MAHDFNNFLTAINSHAELVMTKLGHGHELYGEVERIRFTTGRAAELTRKLLQLSHRHHIEALPIDINAEIMDMALVLRHLVHEGVEVRTDLAEDAWTVLADAGSLHQVIMNLAVNASHAMPREGIFSIRTRNVVVDEMEAVRQADARPGRYVCLEAGDTGVGMDEKTLSRIFEPFFTTREPGQGTGLGLSTVYGIVRQHDGWVTVESEVGKGTTFALFLPVVAETPTACPGPSGVKGDTQGGGRRILLVEDDVGVRDPAARALRAHGYVVDEAEDAEAALRLFRESDGQYDLVFTDVVLPGMSGIDLAERLLERRRDLPIVLTSGWTGSNEDVRRLSRRGIPFVSKPYEFSEILDLFRGRLP